MKFEQLYLLVDKMFKEVEAKLAYDPSYNYEQADQDVLTIAELIESFGWNIEDFNRQMILSAYQSNFN
jgi:hypothetical protein